MRRSPRVFEGSPVLLVAVRTAVTRWKPGALRDDQGGPLDPPEHAALSPALDLRRDSVRDGAVGARLLSTLASPLSADDDHSVATRGTGGNQ